MSKRTPEEIIHSVERYQRGETSQGAEAKRLGVSKQTFQDWIRAYLKTKIAQKVIICYTKNR